MKVVCKTNLDLAYEKWPNDLPCPPNKGDLIESEVNHNGFRLQLEVFSVIWKSQKNITQRYIKNNGSEAQAGYTIWYPEIELHIPKTNGKYNKEGKWVSWSITDFYEWYAPLVGKSVSSFI